MMKIEIKKIKKYASNALLALVVTGGLVVAINEYTVNHNDNICLLTRIVGYEHQITKINTDEYNIENGIFAVYSPKLYELPDGYVLNYDDKLGYKTEESYVAYDVNNNNEPYVVPENIRTTEPTFESIPSILMVKTIDNNQPKRVVIKSLRLK